MTTTQRNPIDLLSSVLRAESLDLDRIPRGRVEKVLIRLVSDDLGFPLSVPVLIARGRKDGPTFGITSAIHGNEINGIPVIHKLFERLDLNTLRGTVVAVIVANVPGFIRQQRKFIDGTDLNHIMPGREDGNTARVYAARFLERIVRHFDYLVDLHTASFGRVNSLYIRADMTQEACARMAYLQRPQVILHNPPSDGTLRGAAMELGIPSITVEIGDPQVFQPAFIKRSIVGLRRVLSDLGMTPKRTGTKLPPKPIICARSYWLYANAGGILEVLPDLLDPLKQGEEIARMNNVFGDLIQTWEAPEDGIVIGKSTNPVGQTGARILHLGIVAQPNDPALSILQGMQKQ